MNPIERLLCLATRENGHDFLKQCAQMGARPTLLTLDELRDAAWPREAIEDLATMPAGLNHEQILNTVSWMARGRSFDRVVALDESDLETAAQIREHMRIPGMGTTTAGCYCDRLAMRVIPRAFGHPVPEYCPVLNYDQLREFMRRVPAPWLLWRRAGSVKREAQRIEGAEQLWRTLDYLGDLQSRYLLEQEVAGDQFCVHAVVSDCEVKFQAAHPHKYADGRESTSTPARTVDRESREFESLATLNSSVAPSLGMVRGVTRAIYLRAHASGRWCFLEIAAGVGRTDCTHAVEESTGVNLWREWARVEVLEHRGEEYLAPVARPLAIA